jgi:hypothetical protein
MKGRFLLMGLKAEAKKFLRAHNVRTIKTQHGELRLGNARTTDLLKVAFSLGF